MSGVLVVPNAFANAVTATGAQLDADFNTVTAYINDPTNRNNYVADGGAATNTISLTFSPPVVGGYTAGLQITFKVANGNTGAVVLNANSLGNKNLFSPAGVALTGGEITSGQIIEAAYDGTQFQMLSQAQNLIPATAATVSQALSNASFVTPGRMQNHPGVAKAYAGFVGTATGTIVGGAFASLYNVTNVVRQGTGTYAINFATAMADTLYAVIVATSGVVARLQTRATTQCVFATFSDAGTTAGDFALVSFTAFGTQ